MVRERLLDEIDAAVKQRSHADAARMMESLCSVGPRPVGGAEIRQARSLIADMLSDMGAVDVREEEVLVRVWHPGVAELYLLEPHLTSFPCVHCLFSPPADETAHVIDVGAGTPKDFARPNWAVGAVALMEGFVITPGKYTPLSVRIEGAAEAGASGVILRSSEATGLPAVETVGIVGNARIPCVSVSKQAGDAIARAVANGGARVRMHVTGCGEPGVCANLVADLRPDSHPDETIVLGAHLDSFHDVPGVLDNLTGVVTTLEIARLLAPFRSAFRRDLRLIAYTGEETGFLGSKAYVARHASELDRIRFVINVDGAFAATAQGMAVMWSPQMRNYIARAFEESERKVDVRNMFCMSSDYLPFMMNGIPAARPADFENSFPIWSHTQLDDLEHTDIGGVQENARIYASLLGRMLTDPEPLPAVRLTPDQVWERLDREGVIPGLQAFGIDI